MAMEGQVSDVDMGSLPVETSLFSLIKRGLDKSTNATIAIVTHQTADHLQVLKSKRTSNGIVLEEGPLSWTYADMQNASLKLIAGLEKRGAKAGSTIATFIPNGIEPLLFHWTSMLGKYTYAPLDPGATSTLRSAEAQTLLETTVPDVLVVADVAAAASLDPILASLPNKPVLKMVLTSNDTPLPPSWTDLLSVASQDVDEQTEQRITLEAMNDDLDRIATILFTSGTTTGRPKGCPRTVKNLLTSAISLDLRLGSGEYRYAYISQNFRVVAGTLSIVFWSQGHSSVLPGPGLSPPDLLDAIAKYHINWLVLLPFALHATVAHPMFQKTDVCRVETVGIGGDMITRDLFRKAVKAFPNADVFVAHGMTEGGGVFKWPVPGVTKEDDLPWHADIAPLGKVQKGARLKIADEDNRATPRNAIGELHISSNAFLRRYSGDVKPEDFYTDQGTFWFKTGDTGLMNSDGWMFVLGRKKDIIKRAGVPITPSALESALDVYLESQTSVIAVPHETLGQEPFAVVRHLNGHTKERVKKHIVDLFGPEYALGGVVTLEDLGLSNFPINQTDKIMKLDLQRVVAQYIHI